MNKPKDYAKRLKERCFVDNWKQQKEANCIAIGGMIAAGKTTLVETLVKELDMEPIYELNNDPNDIMNILLDKMYQRGEKIAESVCQLHFILNRYEKYKEGCCSNPNKIKVFDRSIFEDRLFAFHNMLDQPTVFEYYEKLWREKVNELVYNIGTPKLYIILKIDWDLFLERLHKRNRAIEIKNFEKNKVYFQLLNECYVDYLVGLCNVYRIPYVVVDAALSQKEKNKIVLQKLKELGIKK